ncbi:MAG: hypothetical protein P4M11_04280 [Candidatus Pacebacteria bacterium]|nr:hypothetical protein [Candidatus Paceibacterota bacterium]
MKLGWVRWEDKCASGKELVSALQQELSLNNYDDNLVEVLECLLERGYIYSVTQRGATGSFSSDANAFYKFQIDKEGIAANLAIPWIHEYRSPVQVSAELVQRMQRVLRASICEIKAGCSMNHDKCHVCDRELRPPHGPEESRVGTVPFSRGRAPGGEPRPAQQEDARAVLPQRLPGLFK